MIFARIYNLLEDYCDRCSSYIRLFLLIDWQDTVADRIVAATPEFAARSQASALDFLQHWLAAFRTSRRIGIIGIIGAIGIILIAPIALIILIAPIALIIPVFAAGGPHGFADAAALQEAPLLRRKHPVEKILCLNDQRQRKIAEFFGRQSPAQLRVFAVKPLAISVSLEVVAAALPSTIFCLQLRAACCIWSMVREPRGTNRSTKISVITEILVASL